MLFIMHWFMQKHEKEFSMSFLLPEDHYRHIFFYFTLEFLNSSSQLPPPLLNGINTYYVSWCRVSYPVNLKRQKDESFGLITCSSLVLGKRQGGPWCCLRPSKP